jgi:acylphosphatase
MNIRRRVLISGRVQGVSFRQSTLEEAQSHKTISGFVRNLLDGRVEAVFDGEESEVLRMVAWCGHGPRSARVDRLEVTEVSSEMGSRSEDRFTGFEMR